MLKSHGKVYRLMYFAYRLGRVADVAPCLQLLENSPFKATSDHAKYTCYLKGMMEKLPQNEGMVFVVVENRGETPHRIVGFALSVYITPEFEGVLLTKQPGARLWTELVTRSTSKPSPILNRKQIALANVSYGLVGFSPFHVYDIESVGEPEEIGENPVTRAYFLCITKAFIATHRGNNHQVFYKEIYHQSQLEFNVKNGYTKNRTLDAKDDLHLISVTKANGAGSLVSEVFHYAPPVICFTNRQRELLRFALEDNDVHSLAHNLGISTASIHESRKEIIKRAEQVPSIGDTFKSVLDYVDAHPEELRPYNPEKK
jgi:hypothetical protein